MTQNLIFHVVRKIQSTVGNHGGVRDIPKILFLSFLPHHNTLGELDQKEFFKYIRPFLLWSPSKPGKGVNLPYFCYFCHFDDVIPPKV